MTTIRAFAAPAPCPAPADCAEIVAALVEVAERLHAASLRQTDCLIDAVCLIEDEETLTAIFVAAAGTLGPWPPGEES